MRGSMPPDSWSYSPPNRSSPRESPERRRQARGRVGLGRPTSIGSARFVALSTNPPNAQRVHLQNTSLNTHNTGATPRRAVTPGLPRSSGSAGSTTQTPPRNRLSETSSSSEEASPPVAVGSGVAAVERQVTSTTSQHHPGMTARDYMNNQWQDPFDIFVAHGERGYFPPGRPSNSRTDMGQPGGAIPFGARPTDSDLPQHSFGELNFSHREVQFHEAMGGNPQTRW